ncbi:MAG: sugar phosphate isomerase/epimerase [Desulfobacteraceae bacterium]|nr:sugar phosphate isomerase/epimerase [Desulfobacteraceae bacterium]
MPEMSKASSTLRDRPFRLGTTSFIYPDDIIPNVKKIGAFFDEIELLVFESIPDHVLPSKDVVKELFDLSQALDVTYNVHLPVDISITDSSPLKRKIGVDTIKKVMDLFSPLNPTTHTLHVDFIEGRDDDKHRIDWEKRAKQSLSQLVPFMENSKPISIETLDYPIEYMDDLIRTFHLQVCVDAGHQLKYGHNLLKTFEKFKDRTPIIHLHGVDFSMAKVKDHTSLDKTPAQEFEKIRHVLNRFSQVVSLEVFSLKNLIQSLAFLSRFYNNIPYLKNGA